METKSKENEIQRLLTTKDVAKYFGVHTSVVTQKFCKEGLKFIRLSKTDFRFDINDVIEFKNNLKEEINIDNYVDMLKDNFSRSYKRCDKKI